MWSFIKNLFFQKSPPEFFTGAISPTKDQLDEMPKFEELVATASPVVWKQLDLTKLQKYPIYSQNGSCSCVAMSVCLIASILYFMRTNISIMFSPAWLYQQRSNKHSDKHSMGMIGTDAFKIASKGLLPEILMPSQNLNESRIDSVKTFPWYKTVAEAFAFEDTLVELPIKDIDIIASVIQVTGKPVNVWFEFVYNEWMSVPFVSVAVPNLRHSVVAVDFGIYQGERAIVIQDSWSNNATEFGVFRIIKQSFFNKRNIFSAYPRRFKFESTDEKPSYDGTIVSFQKCLKSIGLFPVGVSFIENFGPLTKKACVSYQSLRNLPMSGIIDAKTVACLQQEFA
jgi:hypothetical protein